MYLAKGGRAVTRFKDEEIIEKVTENTKRNLNIAFVNLESIARQTHVRFDDEEDLKVKQIAESYPVKIVKPPPRFGRS
ncbi:hypothetical protein [Niallia endozanthoxylica]|uniref:Uncharacterized protein n=1 Tax=Niallia endozanthoxylica TaxID=2036016 RepID=A0A5J5HN10_9BACI|nr:hypothetical protein [Niallia endozanthoxylica]KAA9022589.1 hypothetical protein F4V44_15045 [Niallia endozanthoxylica]